MVPTIDLTHRQKSRSILNIVGNPDNLRNDIDTHHQQILVCLLDQPGTAQQDQNDEGAQDHSKELSLKNRKSESCYDEVCECA